MWTVLKWLVPVWWPGSVRSTTSKSTLSNYRVLRKDWERQEVRYVLPNCLAYWILSVMLSNITEQGLPEKLTVTTLLHRVVWNRKVPATGPYPVPIQSSRHLYILLL